MKRSQDRVTIVTGVGPSGRGWGNGRSTAALFAREGAMVVVVDMNAEAASETAAIIEAEGGVCLPVVCDVSDPSDVERLVSITLDRWERIDVLHNKVGVYKHETMEILSVKDREFIININLKSASLTCHAVLPHMIRQGKATIVNISSINATRYARRSFAAYSKSKGGMLALTRVIAVEYGGRGIRANGILPGHIDTPMVRAYLPEDVRPLRGSCASAACGARWARWGRAGTSHIRRCFSHLTKQNSSPGQNWSWMGAPPAPPPGRPDRVWIREDLW